MQRKRDRSKNQHWVPQFYLRHFATPSSRNTNSPQVWIFSKEPADGDEKLTHVRNVCGKRYLYSPMQTDGERSWALDERLDHLESLLGAVWPELAEGFAPLDDEAWRKGIALFVAVMHLRNPEVRHTVEEIHRQLVSFYQSGPLLADGTPNVNSFEFKGRVLDVDLTGWHEYRRWTKHDHDRFFAHFVQAEATHFAKLLLPKRWSVVFSELDAFITTDKPVAIQHQSRQTFGFGTSGSIVTFPLSPRRLLVMDDMHTEPSNQYYPLSEPHAGALNYSVWRGASRFLITGRSVEEVLAEICSSAGEQSGA